MNKTRVKKANRSPKADARVTSGGVLGRQPPFEKNGDFPWSAMAWGFLLVALALAVYIPAMRGGYIIDDDVSLVNNPLLRSVDGLWKIWFQPGLNTHESHYWPLVYSTFWLEYHIWGVKPFGFHAVNVLLHAVNVWLLWVLLGRCQIRGAWLAAALFALHPVHVESVAWVTERKDVLSALFYLLAALVWLRFVRERSWSVYLLTCGLFLCAMLSKSVAVTFPVALLIWIWWKSQRLAWDQILPALGLLALAAALSGADLYFMRMQSPGHYDYIFPQRILIAGHALWFYLGKLLWPVKLMLFYPKWETGARAFGLYLFPLAALALPIMLYWGVGRLGRGPLAAALFFGLTLLPVLGLIDYSFMGYAFAADRFQYLASIGPIALFAAAVTKYAQRLGKQDWTRWGAVFLLLPLGLLTWRQSALYKDQETMLRDNLAKNPQAFAAHLNLAELLKARGLTGEAHQHLDEALRLEPSSDVVLNSCGALIASEGNYGKAEDYFVRAIKINPHLADAWNNLGHVQVKLKKFDEARQTLSRGLTLDEANATAHQALAQALLQQGQVEAAIGEYRLALRLNPGLVIAVYNLAWTLATHESVTALDAGEALELAQRACQLTRNANPLTLDALAAAYARAGQFDKAEETAGRAIQVARGMNHPELIAGIENRRALYHSGQPYREQTTSLAP